MATENLVTTIMLSRLRKCLGEQFSLIQQKQTQTEMTSKNLLNVSVELKSIFLSHRTALSTIVKNEDTLDSSQTKIYQDIKKSLELINKLNETCLLSSLKVRKEGIDNNNNYDISNTLSRLELDKFVKIFQSEGEPDLKLLESPPMRGLMVVQNSITSGDSFEKFIDILKEKGITEEVTSFMVSDFDHGEEDVMIASVKKNNGIYHLEMKAPKPINFELDKEDNAIYCLFQNPIDCFKFVREVIPFNCPH